LGARRPPSAATRVTLQTRAALLQADPALPSSVRRFLSAATNEETLVAANAYVDHYSHNRSVASARVLVSTAVVLRASAQEPVWFAGDASPTASEIAGRYGLRRIDFDRDVPSAWRPYYVRMIASALDDLRRVMPSYDPNGLTIRFVMSALPDSALAMHDPRGHTLLLPVMTGAGTIGHELAHDLDWQSARRLFPRGGGYATDRSMREDSRTLGASIRGLAAAHAVNGARGMTHSSDRPAEVFARGADWFISDALAQIGRSNGYLSVVEDQVLPGYASSTTDAPSLSAAASLMNGMAEMTAIPDSIDAGYLQRWQTVDRLDPAALQLRLRDAPVVSRRLPRTLGLSREMTTELTTASMCLLDRMRAGAPLDRLMAWTIDAKASGLLVRRARALPAADRPAWAHAMIGDPTWDPRAADEMTRRMTAAVLEGAGRARLIPLPPTPFAPAC
jgi:hypothetical protein